MVSSQVHSQHPPHFVFPNVHQHRCWVPNNADVYCREPETSEAICLRNTTPDGHVTSDGYACLGHANIASPFNSSWIQRLIPSQNTRVEQPQPSDKLDRDNHGIDGLQTSWKETAEHLTIQGNQSDFPVYENSRTSMQDLFSSYQTYCGTNSPVCVGNGVNIRPFEASDAQPPEIQVLPKPLPVVESLLPGHSKKVRENQTSPETNMPHVLSRCTGFTYPMKQTIHYSANEKSGVSCSSIDALNTCSVVCAAGDLLALKSLQKVRRCIGPLQPCSEFSFNSSDAVTPSNMNLTYGGKDRQTGTNLRTYNNSTQTEDAFATLHNESRYFDSHKGQVASVPRCQSAENRLLNGYSMPYNCWNPKKHYRYAHDGSEALYAREASFDGGWWSLPHKEEDEPQQKNLVPLHCGSNVAKDKAGIYLSHHMIEQDLGSSRGSHEEQGGTSRSFSFQFERSAPEDHSKVFMRKGQWPFGSSALSNQDHCQLRWSEDNRATGLAKATRLGLPFDNSSSFQETGVREAGTDCIGRSQSSPFFGTENLNESSSCRVFNNYDISPYKAACIDIGGVFRGTMKTEAILGNNADHATQTLKGRHPLSRLESNSMIEGVEGKEPMLSFSSRTINGKNWKALKPSSQCSTPTCPPVGAQSNHADGNCVSTNHWKVCEPPIRSSTYTCPHDGSQLNNSDGNLCSIGSCSKRPSNLFSEDASTSADARSRPVAQEKPVALQEQLRSSQRQCASTGVNTASDDRESDGREATGWEASASAMKQNIWIKRWSTMISQKVQAVSRPKREGGVLTGTTHARDYIEDHYTSQVSHFDLRPAKRICCERRSGLHPESGTAVSKIGSVAVGKEHNEKAVTSHFMKRFFTPSAAAMAIMGMTARKVASACDTTQKSGLFSVWASNASLRKPSGAQAEVCKEFITTQNCKKDISQSAAKVPPSVDS